MNIDWDNIRALDGSQREAFEEICCQLARYEQVPPGSTFIRVGAPDAGVECYWALPNSDEWGWQAKFFTSPPGTPQWSQIDDSVRTALEKHPRLTRYAVCLPIDRQDPRRQQDSMGREYQAFMDKWNERVERWRGWAGERGMTVEFGYWGRHEILERLSREEHRGRYAFWFGGQYLHNQWFTDRLEEALSDAGPRYTPELHVELPVSEMFDALGRTEAFFGRLMSQAAKVVKSYPRNAPDPSDQDFRAIGARIGEVRQRLGESESAVNPIDWAAIRSGIGEAITRTGDAIERVRSNIGTAETRAEGDEQEQRLREGRAYQLGQLYALRGELLSLSELVEGDESELANVGALLLSGSAGTGKTHLLCDVARRRLAEGHPTVLLLGEKFRDGEPWAQVATLLGLPYDRDQLLGALSAAAETRGRKALILIDALNESEARHLWRQHLGSMLAALARFPWIAVALTVRSSYIDVVIPEGLVPQRLVQVEHTGFAGYEYEAAKSFFEYFGMELPSVPLLTPEFSNPLFLKLFCKGLQTGGYSRIPAGLRGIIAIFDFFLDNINNLLSRPERVDFNPNSRPVGKAVSAVAKRMLERNARWLSDEEAETAVDGVLASRGYERSLFKGMVVEGVLAKDRFLVRDGEGGRYRFEDGIRFTYERLGDHVMVRTLLDEYLDADDPSGSFAPGTRLGELVMDSAAASANRGLVEAVSIQLPERIGMELGEVAPACADYPAVREAFVESLLWRDPRTITERTLEHARSHALRYRGTGDKFLDVLLMVAANRDHPYNADFLHDKLMPRELAERDSWWSTSLHEQYEAEPTSPVNRLVDWIWKNGEDRGIDDEVARLAATALGWFLTTPNRFLRDRATKALVALLTGRMQVLRQVLASFAGVNDPYVTERMYAVAYGCVMRTTDHTGLRELAKDVYAQVFNGIEVPVNILLRDHARGVVERALALELDVEVEIGRIRPPYSSDWPEEIPSEESLERLRQERGGYDVNPAFAALYGSVLGFGDFERYVIGTNSRASFEWSSRRLGEPKGPRRKDQYEAFVQSLTERQRNAFNQYLSHILLSGQRALLALLDNQTISSEEVDAHTEVLEKRLSL